MVWSTFKAGSNFCIQSYGSISNLINGSLVFERILLNALYTLLRKRTSSHKFGFMTLRSTITQLYWVLTEFTKLMTNMMMCFCLCSDFCNIFGCDQHSIILNTLGGFEIGGDVIRLLASFLRNKECAKTENFLFSWASISNGVPRGSIFGPLLLLVFMNDLPSAGVSVFYIFAYDGLALTYDLHFFKMMCSTIWNVSREFQCCLMLPKLTFYWLERGRVTAF